MDCFADLKPDGYVPINGKESAEDLGVGPAVAHLPAGHVVSLPATNLALKHLKRPTPNTALLGAFAALPGRLALESVERAIEERFPGKVGEINVAAARAIDAYLRGQH